MQQFAIADSGNVIAKVVMRKKKQLSELVKSELVRFHCTYKLTN
jgi:hypothetical protein